MRVPGWAWLALSLASFGACDGPISDLPLTGGENGDQGAAPDGGDSPADAGAEQPRDGGGPTIMDAGDAVDASPGDDADAGDFDGDASIDGG